MKRTITKLLPGLAVLVGLGVAARLVSRITPINNLLLAVVFGLVIGNLVGTPKLVEDGIGKYKLLLEAGIVLMGVRLVFEEVLAAGPKLFALVVGTIAFTILFVELVVSRLLGIPGKLSSLLASGTSICGVSAIVATAGGIKAREEYIAYAVGTILLFDALTLFVYPITGSLLGLQDRVFGIWAGVSMFSTGPVTAAGFAYSDVAGRWAALTKLTRNVFIGVMAVGYSVYYAGSETDIKGASILPKIWDNFPKFVVGFLLMMVLANIGALTDGQIETLVHGYKWLFLFAFVGLGYNIRFDEMRKAGLRPVVIVLVTLLTVSSITLFVVWYLFG